MKMLINNMIKVFSGVLLCLILTSTVNANDFKLVKNKNVNWEILVDTSQDITFFANTGNGIDTNLFAPFVPGSTYWVKGNLYPAGSVNPNTFAVDPSKKIGEWFCTGTRVRNIFALQLPADKGLVYEEANFTFRLNNGEAVYTKTIALFGEDSNLNVIYSNIKGIKAGDVLTNPNSSVKFSPPNYILVTGFKIK